MTTSLVIQHVEPEGPAVLAGILAAAGVAVEVCRIHEGDRLPTDAAGLSGLVVMGGPMSAQVDDGFPSRRAELDLIGDALIRQIPVLGICLGAQLLALAAGGQVFRGASGPEIGWGTVELTPAARSDRLFAQAPSTLAVLHWHGDTFELPQGAVRLAASDRYPNQAFRIGSHAWGLQFHVEVDVPAVEAFAAAFADEARDAGADPREISVGAPNIVAGMSPARDRILGGFAALVAQYQPNGPAGAEHVSYSISGNAKETLIQARNV